jgi:hypothetical protein
MPLQQQTSLVILKLRIIYSADSKPRAQSMIAVDMEAFMVRKYRLDTTAQAVGKVIRGHIRKLSSASLLPRTSHYEIQESNIENGWTSTFWECMTTGSS